MFALQHIYKSFKGTPVLQDVSLAVNPGDVVALTGENGAGKTTLLKIILGELEPDSGNIALHNETIGYVPQEASLVGTVQDSFNVVSEDWKIDYTLGLVGLQDIPKAQSVDSLSGGQKTRLALAKVLASQPEPTTLLLDEPTNNLDAEGLVWLETFIKNYKGGIILVSHDRAFINKVATGVMELANSKIKLYGGDYDFYKQQKEIEYQTALQRYESNIGERKRLKKAIKAQSDKSQHIHKHIKRPDNDKAQRDFFRNRLAVKFGQNATMLQGRLAQLEQVEKPEARKIYKVTLGGNVPSAKLLLRTENLTKAYKNKTIIYPDFELRGVERLQVQGSNGSGKTTLLQIATGLINPTTGQVTVGQNVKYGYFSQDVSGLDNFLSGLENLQTTGASTTQIFREAGSLGLSQAELSKKPHELSRGQQAKLSLAKLLLSQNHLIILDEPTNHLDIPTRENIEAALQHYQGAMLVASHDTYFMRQIGIQRTISLDK